MGQPGTFSGCPAVFIGVPMALEPHPTLLYTSQTEMESIFGELGVQLRLDDDEDNIFSTPETDRINDIITEATDICNQWLEHYYDPTELETSRWVHRRASWIACHLLARRLGNPDQFSSEHAQAIEDFKMIFKGKHFIPRLTPYTNFQPSVSNQTVDYRYFRSKLRTDVDTSRGGLNGAVQPLDFWPAPWGWF